MDVNEVSGSITGADLSGRTVIIRPDILDPRYASGDRRFKIEPGTAAGFGAKPFLSGRAIFGRFLNIDTRFDRGDIEGFAAHEL
jgi:hypothetical protein